MRSAWRRGASNAMGSSTFAPGRSACGRDCARPGSEAVLIGCRDRSLPSSDSAPSSPRPSGSVRCPSRLATPAELPVESPNGSACADSCDCGRIPADACARGHRPARGPGTRPRSSTPRHIVVDDICAPEVMCDRDVRVRQPGRLRHRRGRIRPAGRAFHAFGRDPRMPTDAEPWPRRDPGPRRRSDPGGTGRRADFGYASSRDARHCPAIDPRRRSAAARRRSADLRDGPARASSPLGDPGGAPGHLGRDDDRRRPSCPGARVPGAAPDGARGDGRCCRSPGARHGPRSMGDRADRHPVRSGQQRRRRVRGRPAPGPRRRVGDRGRRRRRGAPARRIGRPQLGSDRPRHRDRQGPAAGRP